MLADNEGNINVNLENFVLLDGSLSFTHFYFILSLFKRHSDLFSKSYWQTEISVAVKFIQ